MGRHLVREEPPPPKEKPRWRFLVAISGIVVLAFIAMAAVAALFPENGSRAVAGADPTENPFPQLPGEPLGTVGPSPSVGASPTAGTPPNQPRGTRTPRSTADTPSGSLGGVYSLLPGRVWNDGFQAEIMITNGGTTAQQWQVRLQYPAAITRYVTSWMDGYPAPVVEVAGQTVTFTGTAAIPAGHTVNLRFEFKKSAGDFDPIACTVNGRACTAA